MAELEQKSCTNRIDICHQLLGADDHSCRNHRISNDSTMHFTQVANLKMTASTHHHDLIVSSQICKLCLAWPLAILRLIYVQDPRAAQFPSHRNDGTLTHPHILVPWANINLSKDILLIGKILNDSVRECFVKDGVAITTYK